MNILSVQPITGDIIIILDGTEEFVHTRYAADVWYVQMGESEETVHNCVEMESLFQRYTKDQSDTNNDKR